MDPYIYSTSEHVHVHGVYTKVVGLIGLSLSRDVYRGALSKEEMAAPERAAREKSSALAVIDAREREIRATRDGQLTSRKVL